MSKRTSTIKPSDLTPNKRACAADALSPRYQSISVVLLKVELDKRGIVYDKKSRKAALINLLTADDEKPPAPVIEPPTAPQICCICMENEANAGDGDVLRIFVLRWGVMRRRWNTTSEL